ncbi:MAG: hypothetical protein PHQ72_10540 [Hespellia sp.]|nr:hypothetical protein [Hespellia sp.]
MDKHLKNSDSGISKHLDDCKYSDIIHMKYPLSSADRIKHPRMSNSDRAKIFAPFAALKGYEEAIEAKQKLFEDEK